MMSSDTPQSTNRAGSTDGIDAFDLLVVLVRYKKLIVGLTLAAAVISVIVALLIPPTFTATTRIFTPQQNMSASAALAAQFSGIAGIAGGLQAFKNPNDLYIGMLKSRSIADKLIERFDVMKLYEHKLPSQARKWLEVNTKITSGRDGIIVIEVDNDNAARAAAIANAYVEELYNLTKVLAVSEASQRRVFFEQQFKDAKDNLIKAEATARAALEKGGLVKVDEQGRAMVETAARLRAQISLKEVQLATMRAFSGSLNPELQMAQKELEAMRREVAKIEGDDRSPGTDPQTKGAGADSLRALRDVKYYETIYEVLAKQFELAKIDEAKDAALIQVLDKAIEPDFRSKPSRRNIVMLSVIGAFIFAVLLSLLLARFAKSREDPRLEQLVGSMVQRR